MWIIELVCYYAIWSSTIASIWGHLASDFPMPSNKIDQFCHLADTCVHDTIPICGVMGEEKKTFLDTCDLLEYACDSNLIFVHVDDTNGCPDLEALGSAKQG